MVMSAYPVFSAMPDAVRSVHPTGESTNSIPDGPFRDAYMRGPARCDACRHDDGLAAEEAATKAIARRAEAAAERASLLETTGDPETLCTLLGKGSDEPHGIRLSAWRKLAASGALPTALEMTIVEGKTGFAGLTLGGGPSKGRWGELGPREPVWLARDAGSLDTGGDDGPPNIVHYDVYLDSEGVAWASWAPSSDHFERLLLVEHSPLRVVLPSGRRFETVRTDGPRLAVGGGISVNADEHVADAITTICQSASLGKETS